MVRVDNENKNIEVCSGCYRACCWYGEFMCDDAKSSGTIIKTVGELRKLNLEHEEYWSDKKLLEVFGDATPHGFGRHTRL